jgi:MarR family transcriptional regulator, transcriptional regulator for hemolysin
MYSRRSATESIGYAHGMTDVAPDLASELDQDLGRLLALLLRRYSERVGAVLGELPHGPRGYQVLAEVARGRRPNQLELARHLGIDKTVMTYLLDDLESEALVERVPDPDDRRRRLLVPTPAGLERVAGLCRLVSRAEDEVLAALEPAERETVRRLVAKAAGDGSGVDVCAVVQGV